MKTTWKRILGCLPANVVPVIHVMYSLQRNREFKLPWREAGPPNHHDDKVDLDQ